MVIHNKVVSSHGVEYCSLHVTQWWFLVTRKNLKLNTIGHPDESSWVGVTRFRGKPGFSLAAPQSIKFHGLGQSRAPAQELHEGLAPGGSCDRWKILLCKCPQSGRSLICICGRYYSLDVGFGMHNAVQAPPSLKSLIDGS